MPRNLNDIVYGCRTIKYGDLIKSQIATRYSIPNNPNEDQWGNLESLAKDVIQPLLDRQKGIAISSVFRSLELNSKVRGVPNSDHTRGQAVDIDIIDSSIDSVDFVEWIIKNLRFKKLIAENFPDGWVHISYEKGNNDKTLLLKKKDSKNIKSTTLDELTELYGRKISVKKQPQPQPIMPQVLDKEEN